MLSEFLLNQDLRGRREKMADAWEKEFEVMLKEMIEAAKKKLILQEKDSGAEDCGQINRKNV
jgi:hypothetical protein